VVWIERVPTHTLHRGDEVFVETAPGGVPSFRRARGRGTVTW
jgi:hypothetical protein